MLRGSSPFDGLETNREDLRRELEREIRSKLLRLRTEFVAVAADSRALETLLTESAGTFFATGFTWSTPTPASPGTMRRKEAALNAAPLRLSFRWFCLYALD